MTTKLRPLVTLFAAVAALSAGCGGGGSSNPPPPAPPPSGGTAITEGAYSGTLTGGAANAFEMLVLEGGEIWALYGTMSTSGFTTVGGFVQGTINTNTTNLTFTSSTGASAPRDFGTVPSSAATLTGSYTSAPAISGSITTAVGTVQFSGGPIPGSNYNYNATPAPSGIVGTWPVFSAAGGGGSATLTVNTDLTYSADDGTGCLITGTLTPRPSGKNVWNVTTKYGVNCGSQSGAQGGGIAVVNPLNTGKTQLLVGLIKDDRTLGKAVIGLR